MSARAVPEWIGKTADSKIPPRVLQRIHDREEGLCHECRLSLNGKKWQADHRPALINGGENRESMIFPVCIPCHKIRSKGDVAEKAKVAAVKAKFSGIRAKKQNIHSAPFAKVQKVRMEKLPVSVPRRSLYRSN